MTVTPFCPRIVVFGDPYRTEVIEPILLDRSPLWNEVALRLIS